jgi:hypothetical protein
LAEGGNGKREDSGEGGDEDGARSIH